MLKISNIRVNQALAAARTIDCFSRLKKRRLISRVYSTLFYILLIVVVMVCTTHAGVADNWRSFSGFGSGLAPCSADPLNSYSGVSGCQTGDWTWNYVEGNRIKISTGPNQPGTIDAYWVGITGSGNVDISSVPPGHPQYPNRNLTCGSGCFFGIVGYGGGALGTTTYSCQYMGVNCNTNSFWVGTGSYQSASPQPGWGTPAYRVTGQTSSPAWMLVIDPADASKFPGAGAWTHGYLPNSSTYVRVLVAGSSGADGQPDLVMWYGSFPAYPQRIRTNTGIVIPPIVLPPVVPTVQCDTTVDGPINLGTVDQTNAMGRTATTWLRVQCTDDATVKATVRLSGGASNVASLGGLTIPVTFDNNTDTSSWTVSNTAPSATKLTAAVTNVGTTVPGEYSQSMVVNLTYE